MNSRDLPRVARLGLLLVACGVLATTQGLGQGTGVVGPLKVVVSDTSLPGIDRGLRDRDLPREPGARSSRLLPAAVADGLTHVPYYEPTSVIVKFREGAQSAEINAAMASVRASNRERPSWANFEIVQIPAGADPQVVAAELSERREVEYAQARYRVRPAFRPNDPQYALQWSFPALDMERAWDIQPNAGSEIVVAVIDTGAAFENGLVRYIAGAWSDVDDNGQIVAYPALGEVFVPVAVAPELGAAKFVAPRDFIWNDNRPYDFENHGTHVSATVGQLTNNSVGGAGMAFNARIMPVKVLDSLWDFIFGNPTIGTDDVVARGVRYAADNGAKVINLSLGRDVGGPSPVMEDAFRYAVSRGAFVAIASGNSADTGNRPNRLAESAPAIDGVIQVGAVGRTLDRAYYSTFNSAVEIVAPGGDQRRNGLAGGILQQTLDDDFIHTYDGGPATYRAPQLNVFADQFFQGTSMATPHVSGFAALLMQQGITNPAVIEIAMKRYARDLGPAGVDSEYGHGLIQPRTTLRGLGLAR